uniref:Protein quiver n=1 Tax=Steinernema glaseri TaxID=37863 RepID=A0A1I7YXZ3_9BILA
MLLKTPVSPRVAAFVFIFSLFSEVIASKSRCFSCASSNLQSNFLTINRGPAVRKKNPRVFDNFCNGDTWIISEKSLMDCDGPCFKWQQIVNNTGVHSVLTIRGCYSDMFDLSDKRTPKVPANAFCSETRADLDCLSDANVIEHTCWCDGDKCNLAPAAYLMPWLFLVPFVLFLLK